MHLSVGLLQFDLHAAHTQIIIYTIHSNVDFTANASSSDSGFCESLMLFMRNINVRLHSQMTPSNLRERLHNNTSTKFDHLRLSQDFFSSFGVSVLTTPPE